MTNSTFVLISINLQSQSEKAGPLTWQRRARDEHSFRESYSITVAGPPFYRRGLWLRKLVPATTSRFGPAYMFWIKQHFSNHGRGYNPDLHSNRIVERLLGRITPCRGVTVCTFTSKPRRASRPRSAPSQVTLQPPAPAFSARTCTYLEAEHAHQP